MRLVFLRRFRGHALFACAAFLCLVSSGRCQNIEFTKQQARSRVRWEHVDLPQGEKMGLASYHLDFLNSSSRLGETYLGLGGYGAVTGNRGGFFVWGPSAGFRRKIAGELALDSGFFVGGGGGAGAPQGGGLMVRPHIGLEHPFCPVNLHLEASHVRFPSVDIASTGIYLGLTIPWVIIWQGMRWPATNRTSSIGPIPITGSAQPS